MVKITYKNFKKLKTMSFFRNVDPSVHNLTQFFQTTSFISFKAEEFRYLLAFEFILIIVEIVF